MSSLEEDFTYGVTVAQTNINVRLGQYFGVFILCFKPKWDTALGNMAFSGKINIENHLKVRMVRSNCSLSKPSVLKALKSFLTFNDFIVQLRMSIYM